MPSKKKEPERRVRDFRFTLNNYTDEDIENVKNCPSVYTIFGKEIGPKCGTPHLQGYIYLKDAHTTKAMTKKIPHCSFFYCDASAEENAKYCGKDDKNPWSKGVMPKQGRRKDIEGIKELIDEGGTGLLLKCFEANFALTCRTLKGFEKYIFLKQPKRCTMPQVFWRWGPTRSGKSRWAFDEYGRNNCWIKPDGWFDTYDFEKALIINDFDASTMATKDLLQLLDRYPYTGKVKGGFTQIDSPVIVITSDKHPSAFWKAGNDLDQLMGRLTACDWIPFCLEWNGR